MAVDQGPNSPNAGCEAEQPKGKVELQIDWKYRIDRIQKRLLKVWNVG